jgi:hypothetical protein
MIYYLDAFSASAASTASPLALPSSSSLAWILSASSGVIVRNCSACMPPTTDISSLRRAYTMRCRAGWGLEAKAFEVTTTLFSMSDAALQAPIRVFVSGAKSYRKCVWQAWSDRPFFWRTLREMEGKEPGTYLFRLIVLHGRVMRVHRRVVVDVERYRLQRLRDLYCTSSVRTDSRLVLCGPRFPLPVPHPPWASTTEPCSTAPFSAARYRSHGETLVEHGSFSGGFDGRKMQPCGRASEACAPSLADAAMRPQAGPRQWPTYITAAL